MNIWNYIEHYLNLQPKVVVQSTIEYEKSKNIEQERQEIINTLKDMKLTGMKLMNLGEPNNCIVIKDNKCYMFNYDKGDLEEIDLSIYIYLG